MELNWFIENIGKRIYPVSNPKSSLEAKDGVFVSGKFHAIRLYIESRNNGVQYSTEKRWF